MADNADFDGTLHLIFLPAEEGAVGALRVQHDGLFEPHPCDAVFALHNRPGPEAGRFVFRSGPCKASIDSIVLEAD